MIKLEIKASIFSDFLPHCRLIKKIGEGAFANVYLIYDEIEKQHFAVKKIACFGFCEYEKKCVLNEVKILSSIHHSNIIQFHSCLYDQSEDSIYIFMEYAEQGDLLNFLQKAKMQSTPIRENIIWKILADISEALKNLHQNNIIHRDVKPANILIQGRVFKLADMNISKIKEEGQWTKTNIGTPLYTSPEVASSNLYNEKCDIWSLGVVILELCCMKNPLNMVGLTNLECNKSKMCTNIPLRYSNTLNQVIKRMLTKDPEYRIQIDQILDICQKQGIKINQTKTEEEKTQFKTIVFPETSQRWINLVEEKKERPNLDLTIDELLKDSSIRDPDEKEESDFLDDKQNSGNNFNYYGLDSFISKQSILKPPSQNVKVNNFIKDSQFNLGLETNRDLSISKNKLQLIKKAILKSSSQNIKPKEFFKKSEMNLGLETNRDIANTTRENPHLAKSRLSSSSRNKRFERDHSQSQGNVMASLSKDRYDNSYKIRYIKVSKEYFLNRS